MVLRSRPPPSARRLACRVAAEYDAPVFQPHVTMIGTVDSNGSAAMEMFEPLLADLRPFGVTFSLVWDLLLSSTLVMDKLA